MSDSEPLGDRLKRFRDRQLTSPRFHARVLRLAVTRIVARRESRRLFDVVAGFVYSQVLVACVRLEVFSLLSRGPLDESALRERLQLDARAFGHLVDAAVALRLLERRSGRRIGLGVLGASLLAHPGVVAMVEHHDRLYADLRDPIALLRGTAPERSLQTFWSYARSTEPRSAAARDVEDYSRLMSESQAAVAREVLAAYPLHRHRVLLDVGGGTAAFALAAVQATPSLSAIVFDLPAVAAIATERIANEGLSARVRAVGGDFFRDALPAGADLISFVRVLHDHDDDRVVALLTAARAVLAPEGAVLIAEPMTEVSRGGEANAAYFSMYLLAMGSGRPRSARDYAALLARANLRLAARPNTRLPLHASVLLARPA